MAVVVLVPWCVGAPTVSSAAIPIVANPTLLSFRRLVTNPFPGGVTTPVGDAEGLAFDPVRNTLWLADDTLGQALEIDYATGQLRTVVSANQFAAVPAYGVGPVAGPDRIGDNEGLAYDADADTMYMFSGPCCSAHPHLPAAYRFMRKSPGGPLLPESYQPIGDPVHDFSGAAVLNGKIYVSGSKALYTYDYPSDAVSGPVADLPFVSGTVTGLGFSPDGHDLWLTNTSNDLWRLSVPGFTPVPHYYWSDLRPWGIRDGRAVEVVGDQLVIADGYDSYGSTNPDRHAIHVLGFNDPPPPPTTTTTTTTTTSTTTTTQPPSTTSGATTTTAVPPPVGVLPSAFVGVTPARLMDTRSAPTIDQLYQGTGRVGPGAVTRVRVVGRAGVPDSGVGAVALNLTAVGPSADTYLTVWPRGATQPAASNLNIAHGDTVPNMVIVPVGVNGEVEIYNDAGAVDVLVDVLGWLPAGVGFTGVSPARLLDTRNSPTIDGRFSGVGALGAGAVASLPVVGRGSVPASGVGAVALNVTAVGATVDSYLTVWPAGVRPVASNVNVTAGETVANMVVVPVAADGSVQLYNDAGRVDVVVDVLGWFAAPSGFTPLSGARLMDTRDAATVDGLFRHGGPLSADGTTSVRVVGRGGVPAAGVGAVVLNVTAVAPTKTSYLTVWPTGRSRPTASNLNLAPGRTAPNMVIVPVGTDGTVSLYDETGSVDLVVDVLGWFPAS